MRDWISLWVNGAPVRASGAAVFEPLALFLRRELGLCGTKIACAQGACGACSVLVGHIADNGEKLAYRTFNSCLPFVFQFHGAHIVTVEGLNGPPSHQDEELTPIQTAFVEQHGAQCGFCTPGFMATMTLCGEKAGVEQWGTREFSSALCGNLCRCTGYSAILEATQQVNWEEHRSLNEIYSPASLLEGMREVCADSVHIQVAATSTTGAREVLVPANWSEALQWKAEKPAAKPVAGATEIAVELGERASYAQDMSFLCLGHLKEGQGVTVEGDQLVLGAMASWAQVQSGARDVFPELAAFLERWGSPQLRHGGTVAGSVVKASPIADSLPFLLACEAQIVFESSQGSRTIGVEEWLENSVLPAGELVKEVRVPLPTREGAQIKFAKVSRRAAFDRSVVNAVFWWKSTDEGLEVRLAFGGVASRAVRLHGAEALLSENLAAIEPQALNKVVQSEIKPRSDNSGSEIYKRGLVTSLLLQWMRELDLVEVVA